MAEGNGGELTVATVLGAARDGPRTFPTYFLLDIRAAFASMYALRLGRLCDHTLEGGGADELCLALVPLGQNLVRRSTAENARMNQASEPDARNVTRGAEDALEVPDSLCSFRVVLIEKPATIVFVENAREAPGLVLERLDILNLDK